MTRLQGHTPMNLTRRKPDKHFLAPPHFSLVAIDIHGIRIQIDLAGKTFTISNPGRRGNLVGGAIISQPNVGILRLGTIKKRVVVIEHEGEDLMAIHPVMHMALTYDHRVVDGVHANGFLYRIGEILEYGDFEL